MAFSYLLQKFGAVRIFKIFQKTNQCIVNPQTPVMQIMLAFQFISPPMPPCNIGGGHTDDKRGDNLEFHFSACGSLNLKTAPSVAPVFNIFIGIETTNHISGGIVTSTFDMSHI